MSRSKSSLFSITCTCAFVLRRSGIEAVTDGERDASGIVVLHLTEHHAVAIEREAIDGTIEKVIA